MRTRLYSQPGFTLVELAIVLVIIGLLVGGVLVAQDMIRAATVQRIVKQPAEFNEATQAFRLKYHCLPGDCLPTTTALYGITAHPRINIQNGDGNDRICERGSLNVIPMNFTNTGHRECLNYWWHLANAKMLKWSTDDTAGFCADPNIIKVGTATPPIIVRENAAGVNTACAGWMIVAPGSMNYGLNPIQNNRHVFLIMGTFANSGAIASGAAANGTSTILTPLIAYGVDEKMDDALPNSGTVRATGIYQDVSQPAANRDLTAVYRGNPGTATCMNDTVTPNTYNLTGTMPACNLSIQASF